MGLEVRWSDPRQESYAWSRWETFPTTRLYDDFMPDVFDALRNCYEVTGSFLARNHIPMRIDGWWYARGPAEDETSAQAFRRHAEHIASHERNGTHYYFDELRPEIVQTVERLKRHPQPAAPLYELIAHVRECSRAHAHIMWDLHWRLATMITMRGDPFSWPKTYAEITGRPETESALLLAGTETELSRAIAEMRTLARVAMTDGFDSPRFRSRFRKFLGKHGLRAGHGWGSRLTLAAPTWNIAPELPLQMIATYARSDLDAIDRKEKDAAAERRRLLAEVRRELKSDPERLARFEAAFDQAVQDARLMEDHNHWMDQCAPALLREAVRVLGRRLQSDGKIEEPDDVLHLSLEEIENGCIDRSAIADRKRRYEECSKWDAPEKIGASPPPDMDKPWINTGSGRDGSVLRGVAASPGRYTGRARVIPQCVSLPDLEDGDILIAIDAGPNWTPIFAVLGAVVLDTGASFQHAAVMAREFGIPAVLGTKEATTAIADGQSITVDGDAGLVEFG